MVPEDRTTGRVRLTAAALVLLTTLVPVLLSVVLARHQARSDQARRAATFAADVMHRSEQTGDQIATAFRVLAEAGVDDSCDAAGRALMQRIDATSSYVQMVGVIRGNEVVCSSYGALSPPLDLGPVDYVSATGSQFRLNVRLPTAPDETLAALSNGRYAALIHKALPVDTTLNDPSTSLALLTASRPDTISVRGRFDPAWRPDVGVLAPGQSRTLIIGEHVVAQHRSSRFDVVAIAALGASDYRATFFRFARVMVPFGLALGLALGWLLLRVARAQTGLTAAIRHGLRHDQFFIQVQPIVDLADRRWIGAEVLLRWRRADGKLVRPDLFIPAAEENGLITAITARVIAKVEPVLAELVRSGGDTFLSINLSRQDLLSPATLPLLTQLLARTGARPQQVHVEVTERGFADSATAGERVRELRAAGLCVAIDDFGTGYSSLSDLVKFELDTLKIDKTFVDTVGGEAVTSHVAFHIVEMARSLKLDMIAEGIEHEAQADILVQWQVGSGQGWLFSKPLPPEEFLRELPVRSGSRPAP